MKHWMMAALIAGQLSAAAAPLHAADLVATDPAGGQQMGAFAGARLRVPLDGHRRETTRLALTAAPTMHMMRSNGERRMRIGEGFELGGQGNQLRLNYAGRPVSRLVGGAQGPGGERRDISTIGWVAIGVVGVVVLGYVALGVCYESGGCFEGE